MEWQPGSAGARDFIIAADEATTGRPITGALWLPERHDQNTPVILCGHGASGDRYQAPIGHLAGRLARDSGFATLALDGPVHGMRQVGVGGREALAEEMRRADFIDAMVADWLQALDRLPAEASIGTGPLGYFGLSMGTIFGLPLLAAATAAGRRFQAAVLGLAGTTGAVSFISERLLADARSVDMPIAFLMQLEDELFPRDGCLALFDALASPDKRLHANPGLHPEIPAEEVDFSYRFLSPRMHTEVPRDITNPLAE